MLHVPVAAHAAMVPSKLAAGLPFLSPLRRSRVHAYLLKLRLRTPECHSPNMRPAMCTHPARNDHVSWHNGQAQRQALVSDGTDPDPYDTNPLPWVLQTMPASSMRGRRGLAAVAAALLTLCAALLLAPGAAAGLRSASHDSDTGSAALWGSARSLLQVRVCPVVTLCACHT